MKAKLFYCQSTNERVFLVNSNSFFLLKVRNKKGEEYFIHQSELINVVG